MGSLASEEDFATIDGTPVAIHTGPDGALYLAVFGAAGRIVRIAPTNPEPCIPTPTTTTLTTPSTTTGVGEATTSTIGPSRTTTTAPSATECLSGDAASCDDDDACTVDTCGSDGRCDHDPRPGLEGVRCLLRTRARGV